MAPQTNYSVYCYTEDFSSHVMSLSAVAATLTPVTTLCCRSVAITSSITSLLEYVSGSATAETIFSVALDALPSSSSKVSAVLSATAVPCAGSTTVSSSSIAKPYPSSFTFSDRSLSLVNSFVVRGTAGCYVLSASVTSTSNLKYYSGSLNITIISNSVPPSPPTLSSAYFSTDGAKLYVIFNKQTDEAATTIATYASSFKCSALLSFPGANTSTCLWYAGSSYTVQITVGTVDPRPRPSNIVSLLAGKLKAACQPSYSASFCASFAYASPSSAMIATPDNALVPNVSLSAANLVSSCSDIVLDPTASYGQAGRSWDSIQWTVTSTTSTAQISSLLNSKYTNTDRVITIPNKLLQSATYSFTLKVTNFLSRSAAAVVSVTVSSDASQPTVNIIGNSKIKLFRWQKLNVVVNATMSSCSSQSVSKTLSYKWGLYSGLVFLSSLTSASNDPRTFSLAANVLTVSTTYTLTATVTTSTGLSTSQSVLVSVGRSGVRAQIAGGDKLSASSLSPLTLDASSSYDLDGLSTKGYAFNWTCIEYSPNYGSACNGTLAQAAVVTIPAKTLRSSKIYLFTVYFQSPDGYSDSKSVSVTVLSVLVPMVHLEETTDIINPTSRFTLDCSITSTTSVRAAWSCSNCGFGLSDSSASEYISAYLPAGTIPFPLVLPAYTLQKGKAYSFSMSVKYLTTNATSVSTVTIITNSPPTGGSLSVTPPTGTATNTTFYYTTSFWVDDIYDFPISYVMMYYAVDSASAVIVKNIDTSTFTSAVMGQGQQSNDYKVTCVVVATDTFAASANASMQVAVFPMRLTSSLSTSLSASLAGAHASFSAFTVLQVVGSVATLANTVNCSSAKNCSALNRQVCSGTAHTCGPCLTNFVGVPGDANLACVPASDVRANSRCKSDLDCVFGSCNSTGYCQLGSKSCPNDCYGHGSCSYLDSNKNNISDCLTTNRFCKAVCTCFTGWYGRDCSLTATGLSSLKKLREIMCVNLYLTLPIQVFYCRLTVYSSHGSSFVSSRT